MVKIETRCRIPIWRTFGRITWHVIPEPPATLQGAPTWRIQCHDPTAMCHIAACCHWANSTACHPRATYTYRIAGCCHLVNSLSWFQSHIAGCNSCIHHIENRFSPYVILFFNAVWSLTSGSQWQIQRGARRGSCPPRSPRPNFAVAKVCRIQGWKMRVKNT